MKKLAKNSEDTLQDLKSEIAFLKQKLEEKELEYDAIQEANKMRIRKLGHNLKNPIGVIFSFSDMMIEGAAKYTPEKLDKHLHVIKNSAQFSLDLISAVSKVTRLTTRFPNLILKNIDCTQLLVEIAKDFSETAQVRNIKIDTTGLNKSILLIADEDELKLALSHIVSNSIRFSKDNTTVFLSISENKNVVSIAVSDQGIGISEENLPKVFDDFFVAATYAVDGEKCAGLGLSICKKIIEHHRGSVLLTSELGKGTVATITLPLEL